METLQASSPKQKNRHNNVSFEDKKTYIAELVRRYGSSSSIALFDPRNELFQIANVKGVIGYRNEMGCAVVYGDPVCAPEDLPRLTYAFHEYCKLHNRKVVYVTATKKFSEWAMLNVCKGLIEFGEELISDPFHDPSEGKEGRMLRKKMNHAMREGAVVKEYITPNLELEKKMEEAAQNWLKARQGPQIYLSQVQVFNPKVGKRWFYATHQNTIVGVLVLNELQANQGWLVNLLMATPEAPHGTSELLIMSAMQTLKNEGCHVLSFGAVPTDELGIIKGMGNLSSKIARNSFKAAMWFFSIKGRRVYWEKFHPVSDPSYILFCGNHVGLREIFGVMKAMNVGM
ncbi:MAG: hypothetical protein BGO10_03930 [Chlamydia sp. 32-24]|nr:MAG: hypothetical protein BGO10_03930 [Chlamydia sp. 32-24]